MKMQLTDFHKITQEGGDATILYLRLSRDDELQGESNSIKNQREMQEPEENSVSMVLS